VEPYNALLSTQDLTDYNHISVLLDNEAGYLLAQKFLRFPKPSYWNINRLVAKTVSNLTSGIRFPGDQQFTVADLQTNLVPFPRLHFMTTSMAPLVAEVDVDVTEVLYEDSITDALFQPSHMFVRYHEWDVLEDQYMGISITYRGNCVGKRINRAILEIKEKKIKLVEWCPTGFKLSLIDRPTAFLPDDGFLPTDRSAVMIGNNTAVARPLQQRIAKKFDLLYSQRAFVHWYVGEGMEEGEFAESRENLELLLRDYTETKHDESADNADS